jgi:methylated-DNA-[protein]-cysteine S-methyltransferase
MTELYTDEIPSPIGDIVIAWRGEALRALYFCDRRDRMLAFFKSRFGEFELRPQPNAAFRERVARYFQGDFAAFDGAVLNPGGTAFQQKVWNALLKIPAGKTAGYGELAARLGAPSAARAVGLANSLNPISIAIPCHRVVGASGKLTGYGGGLERKQWLLEHEARGKSAQVAFRFQDGPRIDSTPF